MNKGVQTVLAYDINRISRFIDVLEMLRVIEVEEIMPRYFSYRHLIESTLISMEKHGV